MASTSAFTPQGSTVLVGTSAVQVPASGSANTIAVSYRVRNLQATQQYLTWGSTNAVTAGAAPTAGNPTANTVGLLAGSVETFTFPSGSWFISATVGAFEITPGEGI